MFNANEVTFLAGYLAAGVSRSGVVGTFGGMQIPPVTAFMDGFYLGVEYYNQKHGSDVKILGWDPSQKTGLFTGNFNSADDGFTMGESLMDEGADVILPVAESVGFGAAAAAKDRGNTYIIGVDSDWRLVAPEFKDLLLTSVLKNMDITTRAVIKSAMQGSFQGGEMVGSLGNGGVSLAPFHDLEDLIPDDLKAELEEIRAGIIAGSIVTK